MRAETTVLGAADAGLRRATRKHPLAGPKKRATRLILMSPRPNARPAP
ncbi:hypothetical protein [Methylobacterium marchantiae]|uniref:Uncharacterized protein n=1 Tax=Methylobacterium marchantiae TaxID=600331 RepID=A0ABW3X144_9HYPH|nr:hypothetical protein AIGOOFII_2730 [Methylobacterium marchantiae]